MDNINDTNRTPRYPDPAHISDSGPDGGSSYGNPGSSPDGGYTYDNPGDSPDGGVPSGYPSGSPIGGYPSNDASGDPRMPSAEPPYSRARKAYRTVDKLSLWLILLAIGVQLISTVIVVLITTMGIPIKPVFVLAIQLMPMYIICYPLTLMFYRRVPSLAPRIRTLGAGRFIKYLLACFPVIYIGNLIGNFVSSLVNGGRSGDTLSQLLSTTHIIQFVMVVILAPIFEELIFRKAIIDRIGRYGELTAIFLSALTFGLFHMNFIQFFYAFGLGIIFAYLYLNTGRIRYTILLHMIINFFGSVVSSAAFSTVSDETMTKFNQLQSGVISFSEFTSVLPQMIWAILYIILIVVLSIIGIVVIIANRKAIRLKPTPEEVPLKVAIPAAYGNVFFIITALLCIGSMIAVLFM